MKSMLRPALVLFFALTLLTGLVYPLVVTRFAQSAFPDQAAGSLVVHDGKVVGSMLIGQNFTDPGHFWGRPSATGTLPYNAAASGGSNLGPLNPALADAVKKSGCGAACSGPRQRRRCAGRFGDRIGERAGPAYQSGCRRLPD